MYAAVGDRIVVCSARTEGADRTGEIVDVRRPDGRPPYLVRWDGDHHESLTYPGSDTFFVRVGAPADG
jgi:hypothetical protein